MKEMELVDIKKIDYSKWVHPVSRQLVSMTNNDRGKLFEEYVADQVKSTFPRLKNITNISVSKTDSSAKPDISFVNCFGEKKFIEVKSVQQKERKSGLNYQVTRLKLYDRGDYGKNNFDYLVVGYIHPSRGVIFRSLTHSMCEKAVKIGSCRYTENWKGYSFDINDFGNLTHSSLNMYDGLDCIYENEIKPTELPICY